MSTAQDILGGKSQTLSQFMDDRNNQLVPLNTQCSHYDFADFQRSQNSQQTDKVSVVAFSNF